MNTNPAVKGFLSTIPLTAVMLVTQRVMTGKFRPIPPDLVTEGILEQNENTAVTPDQFEGLMWISHFGFGALAGTAWPFFSKITKPIPTWASGPLFGLTVWWLNYNLVLPKLGIVNHTKRAPKDRNIELILSHLLWGYLMSRADSQNKIQKDIQPKKGVIL